MGFIDKHAQDVLNKAVKRPLTVEQERRKGLRTLEEAIKIAKRKGEVLAVKFFSAHPDDDYLFVVLVRVTHDSHIRPLEYVTWEVNTSCCYCFAGHYFDRLDDARVDFDKRGYLPI